MALAPSGRRIGDARVLESLHGLTMEVFRAVWPAQAGGPAAGHPYRASSHQQAVVARCLSDKHEQPAGYREYFEELFRLRHALGPEHGPRVIHVHAIDGRTAAWIEEDVGDVSFRLLMDRVREPLPLGLALHLARAVAAAWRALEALGVAADAFVDRSGVRLGWDGRVRLLVCPAKRPRSEMDPTVAARRFPGLLWFAPEAMRGTPRPESAMFAVGMLLFEALAGRHPFDASSDLDVIDKVLNHALPDARIAMPHVPRPVAELVQRCADKRPEDRFASWAELLHALDDAARADAPAGPPGAGEEELRQLLARAFPAELAASRQRELDVQRLSLVSDADDTETVTVPMQSRTRPSVERPVETEARVEIHGGDGRPMVRVDARLRVDLRPVTCAEYTRYLMATNQPAEAPLLSDSARAALPVTGVTLDDAQAYARWAQKRIPDGDEWEMAVRVAGEALLDVGAIWELSSGERAGDGWVVRGGPWRDRVGERGRAGNLSHSDAAGDVGFRCVADD